MQKSEKAYKMNTNLNLFQVLKFVNFRKIVKLCILDLFIHRTAGSCFDASTSMPFASVSLQHCADKQLTPLFTVAL